MNTIQSRIKTPLAVRVKASSETSGKMKLPFGLIIDLLFLSVCFENGVDAATEERSRNLPGPSRTPLRTAVHVARSPQPERRKSLDSDIRRSLGLGRTSPEPGRGKSPGRTICRSRTPSYHGVLFDYLDRVKVLSK